eukprot:5155878-Prymnesium_polylepis.1
MGGAVLGWAVGCARFGPGRGACTLSRTAASPKEIPYSVDVPTAAGRKLARPAILGWEVPDEEVGEFRSGREASSCEVRAWHRGRCGRDAAAAAEYRAQ